MADEKPRYTAGARLALKAVKGEIDYGLYKLDGFTESDEYVALDLARCTLEAVLASEDPVAAAQRSVDRYLGVAASAWSGTDQLGRDFDDA